MSGKSKQGDVMARLIRLEREVEELKVQKQVRADQGREQVTALITKLIQEFAKNMKAKQAELASAEPEPQNSASQP